MKENKKVTIVKKINSNDLEKIIGGNMGGMCISRDCKDCSSGLGSGNSNTDTSNGERTRAIRNKVSLKIDLN